MGEQTLVFRHLKPHVRWKQCPAEWGGLFRHSGKTALFFLVVGLADWDGRMRNQVKPCRSGLLLPGSWIAHAGTVLLACFLLGLPVQVTTQLCLPALLFEQAGEEEAAKPRAEEQLNLLRLMPRSRLHGLVKANDSNHRVTVNTSTAYSLRDLSRPPLGILPEVGLRLRC